MNAFKQKERTLKMKKRIAKIAMAVAIMATSTANIGCFWWICEEPKALKGMD